MDELRQCAMDPPPTIPEPERKKGQPRPKRLRARARPWLSVGQILHWADAFHEMHGRFPQRDDGYIHGTSDDSWSAVNQCLIHGCRGLPGGHSLARLLAEHRGFRNRMGLPPYIVEEILHWCDAFHDRFGRWPKFNDGPIVEAPGETWMAVNAAIGNRGLCGDSTLAKLLHERRGVRHHLELPPLTVAQVVAWAKAHHARTGRWPTSRSGPIIEAPNETWSAVAAAAGKWPPRISWRLVVSAIAVQAFRVPKCQRTSSIIRRTDSRLDRRPSSPDGELA